MSENTVLIPVVQIEVTSPHGQPGKDLSSELGWLQSDAISSCALRSYLDKYENALFCIFKFNITTTSYWATDVLKSNYFCLVLGFITNKSTSHITMIS